MKNLLLFGSSGQIGLKIKDAFIKQGYNVYCVKRSNSDISSQYDILWNFVDNQDFNIKNHIQFNSICFAHGVNINDSIYNFDPHQSLELYKSNCFSILIAINKLLKSNLLQKECKICIISSIWQNIARQNKMSYCISKSALQGLINSLSVDLAKDGHLINAILPSALDTEMTRSNLSDRQLDNLKSQTSFNKLANINDVANLAYFLCSDSNTSITGQFINVDLGLCNAKII